MNTGRRSRNAFTLVEMLVVVTIIGILAALVLTGIYATLPAVYKSQIAVETATLAQAVERYKQETGDYPPDFTDPDVVERHLRKRFPRNAVATNAAENAAWEDAVSKIDPAEALPFWLASLSSDPILPLTSGGENGVNPILRSNRFSFFDFDQSRLTDIDQDGYPEYYPKNCERAPFVYFDSRTYDEPAAIYPQVADYSALPTLVEFEGYARPYHQRIPVDNNGEFKYFFINEKTFQIITASLDGHYGTEASEISDTSLNPVRVFPTGENYTRNDADNITSFSDGQTLEDLIPE